MTRRLVVLSPGSRSTPLVIALAAEPSLELVDVIDERAAAFYALGHARSTGEAAIVVATSGTAPAHWYPAILEAEHARVPLVCVSADRPTWLSNCGAAQTIDQFGLFGRHVRFFADLGDPRADPAWLRHVERTARRALFQSAHGPVHLNVRAEKPLEPSTPADGTDLCARAVARALAEVAGPRFTEGASVLPASQAERLARRLDAAEAPLVIVGPLPAHTDASACLAFARALGAPIAAEWSSQLRGHPDVLTQFDLLLQSGRLESDTAPRVDLVVQLGATPTPSAYERFVSSGGLRVPRIVLGASVSDPTGLAEEIVLGDPVELARALTPRLSGRRCDARWAGLEARAREVTQAFVAEPGLSEGAAVRRAFAHVPEGGQIVLGNSLPIRLADRYATDVARQVAVISQRGVNGIDGSIAGALGAAHRGRPTLAILGDVTTLHDVGSFAIAKQSRSTLVFLVLDNGGGRIFEQLPISDRPELASAMPHFITEHGVDLGAVAAAFGLESSVHSDASSLDAALARAFERGVPTVLVAKVPPHDARQRERRIVERFQTLAGAP